MLAVVRAVLVVVMVLRTRGWWATCSGRGNRKCHMWPPFCLLEFVDAHLKLYRWSQRNRAIIQGEIGERQGWIQIYGGLMSFLLQPPSFPPLSPSPSSLSFYQWWSRGVGGLESPSTHVGSTLGERWGKKIINVATFMWVWLYVLFHAGWNHHQNHLGRQIEPVLVAVGGVIYGIAIEQGKLNLILRWGSYIDFIVCGLLHISTGGPHACWLAADRNLTPTTSSPSS